MAWQKEELQQKIVLKMISVKGRLRYTQGVHREDIEHGYADCSSLVRWVYRNVTGIDIGEDTAAQIVSAFGFDVDAVEDKIFAAALNGHIVPMPRCSLLEPGDLLFFTGGDKKRPYGVGHVEMYMGKGRLIGQNDRPYCGPQIKDMTAYIQEIGMRGIVYIKARRYIKIC